MDNADYVPDSDKEAYNEHPLVEINPQKSLNSDEEESYETDISESVEIKTCVRITGDDSESDIISSVSNVVQCVKYNFDSNDGYNSSSNSESPENFSGVVNTDYSDKKIMSNDAKVESMDNDDDDAHFDNVLSTADRTENSEKSGKKNEDFAKKTNDTKTGNDEFEDAFAEKTPQILNEGRLDNKVQVNRTVLEEVSEDSYTDDNFEILEETNCFNRDSENEKQIDVKPKKKLYDQVKGKYKYFVKNKNKGTIHVKNSAFHKEEDEDKTDKDETSSDSSVEDVEHSYSTETGMVSLRTAHSVDNLNQIGLAGTEKSSSEDSSNLDEEDEVMKMIIVNDLYSDMAEKRKNVKYQSRKVEYSSSEDSRDRQEKLYYANQTTVHDLRTEASKQRKTRSRKQNSLSRSSSSLDEKETIVHEITQEKIVKGKPQKSRSRREAAKAMAWSDTSDEEDVSAVEVKPMEKVKRFRLPGTGIMKKIRNATSPNKSVNPEDHVDNKVDGKRKAFPNMAKSYKKLQRKLKGREKSEDRPSKIAEPLDPNFVLKPRSFQSSLQAKVKRSVSMSDASLKPKENHPKFGKKFSTLTKESGRMLSQTLSMWNQSHQDFENIRYKVGQSSFYLSIISDGEPASPSTKFINKTRKI